jgi:hypothetical protein
MKRKASITAARNRAKVRFDITVETQGGFTRVEVQKILLHLTDAILDIVGTTPYLELRPSLAKTKVGT